MVVAACDVPGEPESSVLVGCRDEWLITYHLLQNNEETPCCMEFLCALFHTILGTGMIYVASCVLVIPKQF